MAEAIMMQHATRSKKKSKVKGQYDMCMVTRDTAPTAAPSPTSILPHLQIRDTNQQRMIYSIYKATAYSSQSETIRASLDCHAYFGLF